METSPYNMGSMRSSLNLHNHNRDAVELPALLDTPSLSPRRSQPYGPYRPEREEKYIAIGIDFGTTQVAVCSPPQPTDLAANSRP